MEKPKRMNFQLKSHFPGRFSIYSLPKSITQVAVHEPHTKPVLPGTTQILSDRRRKKSIPLSTFGTEGGKDEIYSIHTCRKGTRYFPQKSMNLIFSTRLSKKTPETRCERRIQKGANKLRLSGALRGDFFAAQLGL